ncbi:hypothetical protein [Streptomyces sp. TBY4]|uniref:hypothetical protein n=1 Tax=Streptomyces sp. TBY4 TaxID=2962030 RepID=UPI0020B82063|nr:hypothetical protein [Streptomyces sp. TBY4]MCP3755653.1 hypothetical protein [Streptomyces sp. TBY4]
MRSISVTKSLVLAVLGCIVLSGCGTRNGTTDLALAGGAAPAATVADPAPSPGEEELLRFMELMTRDVPRCDKYVAADKGELPEGMLPGGVPPEPEQPPAYGPPPGAPDAAHGVPVPLTEDVPPPPEPTPGATRPDRTEEVALNAAEECFGSEEARRITEAFENTKTADYQAMQRKLTELDYPAAYIHRMPDHAGAPRARIDMRMMGSRLAMEVTGTDTGVTAEAFGATEEEGVDVTTVKRKPKP